MLKKIRLQLITKRREAAISLYRSDDAPAPEHKDAGEHSEQVTQARYHDDGTRVCISYEESELSGMEGSRTSISYQKNEPGVITMLRDGSVKTALIFEAGKRHHCIYQTPIMPFEVCVQTSKVQNRIEQDGTLKLDYIVEIRGAQAEHTQMTLRVLPFFDKPQAK